MEYEYYITHQANGLLDVDDIGNCAIDLFNDDGMECILVVDCYLGNARIFTYGPFNPDFERLPNTVNCTLKQMPFSAAQIGKEIKSFLNQYPFNATQAIVIEKEEALDKCRNLIDYMQSPIY